MGCSCCNLIKLSFSIGRARKLKVVVSHFLGLLMANESIGNWRRGIPIEAWKERQQGPLRLGF